MCGCYLNSNASGNKNEKNKHNKKNEAHFEEPAVTKELVYGSLLPQLTHTKARTRKLIGSTTNNQTLRLGPGFFVGLAGPGVVARRRDQVNPVQLQVPLEAALRERYKRQELLHLPMLNLPHFRNPRSPVNYKISRRRRKHGRGGYSEHCHILS